jgi:isoamylase
MLCTCCLTVLFLPAGDVWHVAVQGLPGSGVCYAVRVSGNGGWDTGYRWDKSRLLLDPRAPLVAGRKAWGKRDDFEEFQTNVSEVCCGCTAV